MDSDTAFEDIKRLFKVRYDADLKQCQVKKRMIRIFGAKNGESFYSLPTEETLSETMLNSSQHPGSVLSKTMTCETIAEEILEPEPKVVTDQDKIFIPPVKVGESFVAKIKVGFSLKSK